MKTAAPPILAALLFAGLCSATVTPHDRVSTKLSWDGDVQRIVTARCASCHTNRSDARTPDLSTYAAARPWARAIREAILNGHGYSAGNGAALTPFERELLVQWIDGGAPEKPKFFPVEYSRLVSATGTNREYSTGKNFGSYTRVASPAPTDTLARYQARLGGTRGIIPGLGLALRAPDQIVVIERAAGGERVIARGTFVPSLAARLAALPASTRRTRISDAAYAIGPLDEPRTEIAELTPEGPDRFWCAMHPDVRGPIGGTCPRCAMPLVEMPELSLDTFSLDMLRVHVSRGDPVLQMRLTRGAPLRLLKTGDALVVHERRVHVFVVDEALQFFAHVHPPHVGDATVGVDLPAAGRYRVIADFAPVDALPQVRMTAFEYSGKPARSPHAALVAGGRLMSEERKAGAVSRVAFEVAPDGLEPYLGAAAHLFVIDEKLENPMHAHPLDVGAEGLSRPAFDVRFPRAGRYVMWLQVQRAGRVETMRFTADVSAD